MKRALASIVLVLALMVPAFAQQWSPLSGIHAIDISVSGSAIWIVGTDNKVYTAPKPAPGRIAKFVPAPGSISATRISVGDDNQPWVVSTDQGVYRFSGQGWLRIGTQSAIDISVNLNGGWCLGTDNKIYQWTGAEWKRYSNTFKGTRLAVANSSRVFLVGMDGSIFDCNGSDWGRLKDQKGQDIDVTGTTPWIVGSDNGVFYYQGNWLPYGAPQAQAISASSGTPYVIGRDNKPYIGGLGAR
ncbi:MAG: hypothetical protein EB084_17715 [Proteobacteria bacterium]|nr:hypothetical protein [Pseudomonadota bacterium]